jgi:hypothetical protein
VVSEKQKDKPLGKRVWSVSIWNSPSLFGIFSNALDMKIHALAILSGTIVDLILSFGVSLLLPFFGIYGNNPYFPILSLLFGLAAVAVGGYVTARQALTAQLFNTGIFAVIQILISILGAWFVPAPLWFNIASLLFITPAALLGARLYAHLYADR